MSDERIDLSKLLCLPLELRGWFPDGCGMTDGNKLATVSSSGTSFTMPYADAAFHVLARRALEVMLSRPSWFPMHCPNGWCAAEMIDLGDEAEDDGIDRWAWNWAGASTGKPAPIDPTPDPFTCLVAADEWMKELEANP